MEPLTIFLSMIAVLCLLLLIVAMWFYFRNHFTLLQIPPLLFNHTICNLLWRLKVTGKIPEEFQTKQGAVIVCNHRCPFDPWFIGTTVPRIVHWMVAKEFCNSRLFGWFFWIVQSIPANRSGIDTASTRRAIQYAEQGELVGLLPEGRINTTDELLLPGRPGAIVVALKAKVPIIPCYVSGSVFTGNVITSMFAPAKVHLTIGEPIDISEYYEVEQTKELQRELTLKVLKAIATLAGEPDYEPQLAGKKWKPETVE